MSKEINLTVPFETVREFGYDLWCEVGQTEFRSSLPEGTSKRDARRKVKKISFTECEVDDEVIRLLGSITLHESERVARATRWQPAEYRQHPVDYALTLSFNPWEYFESPLLEIEWL